VEDWSSSGEDKKDATACQSDTGRFRLSKEDRIRRSSEYRIVMKQGVRCRTSHFLIRMLRNSLGRPRLGVAASKKVGIACARNRIKRRLREYFRLNRAKLPADMDIVFVALEGAPALDTHQLWGELDRFFARKF